MTSCMEQIILPSLPHYQGFQLRGFVAMQNLPSETRMICALEGASSPGPVAETPYPALNQRSEGQTEEPRLLSQSWTRRVCVSGTASADCAHYWGSSEWGRTALGYKSSPGSSSSHHWTSLAPHLGGGGQKPAFNRCGRKCVGGKYKLGWWVTDLGWCQGLCLWHRRTQRRFLWRSPSVPPPSLCHLHMSLQASVQMRGEAKAHHLIGQTQNPWSHDVHLYNPVLETMK